MTVVEAWIVLAQVQTGISWKDIWDVVKFLGGPILVLFVVRLLTPAFTKTDDRINVLEKRQDERIARLEKEKDEMGKEINRLFELHNDQAKKLAVSDEKHFNLSKYVSETMLNYQRDIEKRDAGLHKQIEGNAKRIDDFRAITEKLIDKLK